MDKAIFLDSNVFMYAAGKPHAYKNACLHILKDVETQTLPAVVSTEIFQELLYRYSHIGVPGKGLQLCNNVLKYSLTILSVTEADIRLEIDLFEKYKNTGVKPRDAIVSLR